MGGVREINLRLTKETSLYSNCLEQELRRRHLTSNQFSLYRMVQSGTGHQHSICISALPHTSGPFPMKWAAQQFLPHHNHSAPNTVYEDESLYLVSTKALWLLQQKAAGAGSSTAIPDTESQRVYPTGKRWQPPRRPRSPAPPAPIRSLALRMDYAAPPEPPLVAYVGLQKLSGLGTKFPNFISIPSHKYFQYSSL